MKILSTPTTVSKQKEVKDLMIEINGLKSEKEVLKRDIQDLSEAKTVLMNETISGVDVSDLKDIVSDNIRRKVQNDISELTKNKDLLDLVVLHKQAEFSSLNEKALGLTLNKGELLTSLEKINSELEEVKSLKQRESKGLDDEIEKKMKELESLRVLSESELKKIEECRKEYEDKKAFLMKEEIRLANKGSDLNIYEIRLRKKYLELMPGTEIIV